MFPFHAVRGFRAFSLGAIVLAASLPVGAQNLVVNPGFENNPPTNFGNNIGYPITPWILAAGNNSNVVKVDGTGGYDYGNGGPESDADPATGSGVAQHYLDIASGANDFYQTFTVPLCGSVAGQTRQATFSGYFSTRDNLSGAGGLRILSGAGTGGAVLAQANVSLPAPPSSKVAPWVQASGTVTVTAGSVISLVVSMDNNLNFDQASVTYTALTCVSAPLTLRKTWANAAVNDTATVSATRAGTVIDTLASVANTANETDSDATPVTVFQGESIVLAELLPATNSGTYTSSVACTGGGTLIGNTLTVGTAGAAITCTYTNARPGPADLSITKTNNGTSVVRGATTTYDIVVANGGPNTVVNAVLKDPAPTNLGNCVLGTPACAVTTGAATCPVEGAGVGQLSVANLQGTGVLIPSLAASSSVTVRVACVVQ